MTFVRKTRTFTLMKLTAERQEKEKNEREWNEMKERKTEKNYKTQ